MKLICWDTSTKVGTLAAVEWDKHSTDGKSSLKLVGETTLSVDATHSERLLLGIHQLLESARWTLKEVDLFGVGVGPGSFTGIRIGVTTARTLAQVLSKPIIGVSSLAALARPIAQALVQTMPEALVIACTDACKGELFALYGSAKQVAQCVSMKEGDRQGLWSRGVEELAITPSELMQKVRKKLGPNTGSGAKNKPWVVVGGGRERYLEDWKSLPRGRELKPQMIFSDGVQGRYVAQLVWEAYQAGLVRAALDIHPRYVRASDAEIKLKSGLLK